MAIQIRRHSGKGPADHESPDFGIPWGVSNTALWALLKGKVVTGLGGVYEGTDAISLSFSDGALLWFITPEGASPRIVYQGGSGGGKP
jgi:hypothetical protein